MMKSKLLSLLILLSVCIISCDDDDDEKYIKFNLEEFLENKAKWEKLELQNYSYEYSNSGYSFTGIASHINIQISDGEESEVVALVENGIQEPDNYLIDDLFEQIYSRFPDDGLADSSSQAYLKEIKVEYDENFHFPSEVHYIYHIPKGTVGLWNMHQYIKNFKLVK